MHNNILMHSFEHVLLIFFNAEFVNLHLNVDFTFIFETSKNKMMRVRSKIGKEKFSYFNLNVMKLLFFRIYFLFIILRPIKVIFYNWYNIMA